MKIRIALVLAALIGGCGHVTPEIAPAVADASSDADLRMLVALRPGLAKKIENLAPADLPHLPWMLGDISTWERRIEGAKPPPPDSRAASVGVPVSDPSDAQLVTSAIGHRIERVLAANSKEAVRRTLHSAGYRLDSITYLYFPIRSTTSSDRPLYYTAPPTERTIHLPIAASSHSAYDAER